MNTLGTLVRLTLFGEGHSQAIGAVLDGLAPGLKVDMEHIRKMLSLRRPCSKGDTPRREGDNFSIICGLTDTYTNGSPLTLIIPNEDIRPEDYTPSLLRPSHADYTSFAKYGPFRPKSGGGQFSGRVTAAIVAAGAVCLQELALRGISIGTHILSCAGIKDKDFSCAEEIDLLNEKSFPVISDIEEQISSRIDNARKEGDSLGGVVQTAVFGLPSGVGEPYFESLESAISQAVFSIGGVKGIEFGSGFALAAMKGSQANDEFRIENGRIFTSTNHSGGINGGISNSMPVIFNTAVRPTPSIAKEQNTVDIVRMENTTISIKGRHDAAIVPRICVVITSIVAVVLCDQVYRQFGPAIRTRNSE